MPRKLSLLLLAALLFACPAGNPRTTTGASATPGPGSEPKVLSFYELASHKPLWQHDSELLRQILIFDQVVVLGGLKNTVGVNQQSGEEVWKIEGMTPTLFHPPTDDGILYLKKDELVAAYEGATGKKLWDYPLSVDGDLVVWGDKVSFIDWENSEGATVKRDTGEKLWEFDGKNLGTDGNLLFVAQPAKVLALDADGKEVWAREDIKPFEIRGVLEGVIALFANPVAVSVGGQNTGMSEGTTSMALSTEDGQTLYTKEAGWTWVGPWHKKACRWGLLVKEDAENSLYRVVDPQSGEAAWEFTVPKKAKVEMAGDKLFRRPAGDKIEILELDTGKVLKEMPVNADAYMYVGHSPEHISIISPK